ncbi:hypothetical protein CcaverHIS002_0309640 [Cutaneotrichosporon cavernicola]|uniref:Uncharacterized protein n=1 Tax=Cutaneotrichosporon cavernicola TaxID=279322 RepID=A0AA48L2W2_9TREE|nr:uncharacterized protein CcaverHIS019_0309480 [Cutaneotrichosporon cavernicola]BEI83096.1 hypothetical protein CcaverHIS002_0309640 [Cutaneotrichosporon cavernicola]BEI90878.1 hypothetical protein CcaverHIS019_0309480 [Cutaneotrichosporon cavernicola]BEI98657.1 hypothetical protein CcaverHIS631_0309560 [Cutaneotrichosporon cavernicola]BEJ06427.1 hypothetical protein CcaverHIS641_0309490 [Cutaneotrichosporon cavernicola]
MAPIRSSTRRPTPILTTLRQATRPQPATRPSAATYRIKPTLVLAYPALEEADDEKKIKTEAHRTEHDEANHVDSDGNPCHCRVWRLDETGQRRIVSTTMGKVAAEMAQSEAAERAGRIGEDKDKDKASKSAAKQNGIE